MIGVLCIGMWCAGASTVKYTTPLPYIGLSESDSKVYINFEICKAKKYINI